MKRFFLMTAGRTGSTAVLDSLNKLSNIVTLQEPFLKGRDPSGGLKADREIVPFFEHFLRNQSWFTRMTARFSERSVIEAYLDHIEERSMVASSEAFGFKILRHHFKDHKVLSDILLGREHLCIYLKRDPFRQAISGQVARKRGLYNTVTEVEETEPVPIDIDQLRATIDHETNRVALDVEEFKARGFPLIVVDYETFTDDTETFFSEIQDFLGLTHEVPPASDYKRVIKSLEDTIANFDEVRRFASETGRAL